jgi:hypothetical protein
MSTSPAYVSTAIGALLCGRSEKAVRRMVRTHALDGRGATWVQVSVASLARLTGRTITPDDIGAAERRHEAALKRHRAYNAKRTRGN